MKKQDIAERLARKAKVTPADAADRLDKLIHDVLAELKRGNPVALPGIGTLSRGDRQNLRLDQTKPLPRGRHDEKR